ncbi:MAG: helix-turn-helix transcriptional regulator [Candidatus Margulisbacteria bacterium]|nr:helix-turn-helix transcriptional regulator [Candidatus Margulisiibacteriota bacterium]
MKRNTLFKKLLRNQLDSRGISQSQLAKRLKVSRQYVYFWTTGRYPSPNQLLALIDYMKLDRKESEMLLESYLYSRYSVAEEVFDKLREMGRL